MDTFLVIFGFFVFGIFCLTTLGTLYGNGIFPIEREWWDDDYKRLGKTTLKSRIKGIFISLLINFIIYLLFYIFVITKFYIGFILVIPIFLFINTIGGPDNPDGF